MATLERIQASTDLGPSQIIRACIIRHMSHVGADVLEPPLDNRVQESWASVEGRLEGEVVKLIAVLDKRFFKQAEETEQFLRSDPHAARELAQYYDNYFTGTLGYELFERNGKYPVLVRIEELLERVVADG